MVYIFGDKIQLRPLEMVIETHIFAWRKGNIVEGIADYFYSILI
jgi:hypothetical protein